MGKPVSPVEAELRKTLKLLHASVQQIKSQLTLNPLTAREQRVLAIMMNVITILESANKENTDAQH